MITVQDTRPRASRAASVAALGLTSITALVDRSPDWVRFGPGRGVRNRVLRRELPVLAGRSETPVSRPAPAARTTAHSTVVLATRTLGMGGVEAVLATLARNLPAEGVDVLVVCDSGGSTADRLRAEGVRVVEGMSRSELEALLAVLPPRTVVQLHNASGDIAEACAHTGTPFINVVHTTDVNLRADDWQREGELARAAAATIAVSATVADFYTARLPRPVPSEPVVIPNGFTDHTPSVDEVDDARQRLGEALDVPFGEDVVFVCLARYDMQKNIPGLVSAFLAAAGQRDDIHLVVAGPVEDWLEPALADAIRSSHDAGGRVHLMGPSSARELLAAADAFVLDSFFEGWPVAATEAATAGLPLVCSRVGGVVELVGSPATRGRIVANAAGDPRHCDLAGIRRERRHPQRQSNRAEFAAAIVAIRDGIDEWRRRRERLATDSRVALSPHAMVRAHAALITQIAGRGDGDD